jgi:hypothetical protein
MLSPDIALALLINRTAQYYQANAPVYMTYTEHTHVSAPSLGRSQDIDRSVAVRVADNVAVMRDLPGGGERRGQAFPIIPYFDPISQFSFSYFANLKRVDINLTRGETFTFPLPAADSNADVVVPYFSAWLPRYATDSGGDAVDLLIDPTSRSNGGFYPSAIVEDPQTQLPSHIEMRVAGGDDMTIALDYKVLDGHWVITHGEFTGTQHAIFLTFKVIADITFDDIAFPDEAPDPRLAGTPGPQSTPATASTGSPTPP